MLGRAGEDGQRLRLEAAKTGRITWQTPFGLQELLIPEEEDESQDKVLKMPKITGEDEPPIRRKLGRRSEDLDNNSHDL